MKNLIADFITSSYIPNFESDNANRGDKPFYLHHILILAEHYNENITMNGVRSFFYLTPIDEWT
jgi:hypothetical protein